MSLEGKDGRAIADRLRELGESEALALAGQFLDDPVALPAPEHDVARTVKAGELLKVWDARVQFAEKKGRAFPGATALVERLTAIRSATELVLHYLRNADTVGLFFFEADDDHFVGLVLADQRHPNHGLDDWNGAKAKQRT
jgi:hypothetical protein